MLGTMVSMPFFFVILYWDFPRRALNGSKLAKTAFHLHLKTKICSLKIRDKTMVPWPKFLKMTPKIRISLRWNCFIARYKLTYPNERLLHTTTQCCFHVVVVTPKCSNCVNARSTVRDNQYDEEISFRYSRLKQRSRQTKKINFQAWCEKESNFLVEFSFRNWNIAYSFGVIICINFGFDKRILTPVLFCHVLTKWANQ